MKTAAVFFRGPHSTTKNPHATWPAVSPGDVSSWASPLLGRGTANCGFGTLPRPQPDKQGGKPGLSKLLASRSHRDADTASRETNELEKFQRWHKQDSQQGEPPCLSEVLVS